MKKIHVVAAIIYNASDEILCAKRSSTMSIPNKWEFPGGKIEDSESHEDALCREIQEELVVEIENLSYLITVDYTYPTFHLTMECYKAILKSGSPQALEHAELKWLPVNRLNELDWAPADIPIIEMLMG